MIKKTERPSWHEYFFTIAGEISKRSTCTHAQMGVVFVSEDNTILSTGYNGSPRGMPHCTDATCDVDDKNFCTRTIHAEVNGIIQAARSGVSLKNSIAYINAFPCYNCFKAIANLPVKAIYYAYKYKPEKYGEQYAKVEKYAALPGVHIALTSNDEALGVRAKVAKIKECCKGKKCKKGN